MCLISVMKYLRNTWNCHRFITSEISVYDNEFFFCLHRTILLVFISYMWKNKPLGMLFIVVDRFLFFLLYFKATLISEHLNIWFFLLYFAEPQWYQSSQISDFYAPLEKGGILFCNSRSVCRSVGGSVGRSVGL